MRASNPESSPPATSTRKKMSVMKNAIFIDFRESRTISCVMMSAVWRVVLCA